MHNDADVSFDWFCGDAQLAQSSGLAAAKADHDKAQSRAGLASGAAVFGFCGFALFSFFVPGPWQSLTGDQAILGLAAAAAGVAGYKGAARSKAGKAVSAAFQKLMEAEGPEALDQTISNLQSKRDREDGLSSFNALALLCAVKVRSDSFLVPSKPGSPNRRFGF